MFEKVGDQLERYMGLLSTRQKLVASNIANVDTPGYKTRDIDFQAAFLNQVRAQDAEVVEPELAAKNDGNNVSIDREARLLAETGMRFQMASVLTRGAFRQIKTAIQEGRNG